MTEGAEKWGAEKCLDTDCADQDRSAVHHFRVFRVFRGQSTEHTALSRIGHKEHKEKNCQSPLHSVFIWGWIIFLPQNISVFPIVFGCGWAALDGAVRIDSSASPAR
jgi:hypothetical protein